MTMETIQNAAAAYQTMQGTGTAADSAQSTPKKIKEEQKQEARAAVTITQPERTTTAAAKDEPKAEERAAEKLQTPEKVSDSALKKAVEDINRQSSSTEAIFGYHEGTKRVTIKIIDKETKEVKKEYPAEKTLDMIQRVWEMAGLMLDEKG